MRPVFSRLLAAVVVLMMGLGPTAAQPDNFVVAWAASVHGPYPIGNATAQPDLRFAFAEPAKGASDQSFRLIVRPDIWGKQARIRLSNVFGSKPVSFDDIRIGLQQSGSAVLPGTNRPVSFGGKSAVTIAAGNMAVSDPLSLPFVNDPADAMLIGRRLAVSFHVVGESGPMTWHAKALTTSYLSAPGSGDTAAEDSERAFPYSTTSWYFLDAVDMSAPADSKAIVAFGDSITDGTASTINGDDRWPDVFARRLHARYGNRYAVVNAGIGGNRVIGPSNYAAKPTPGGPSAGDRLERDVVSLSGVGGVIWLEGINDFGSAGAAPEAVETGVRDIVRRLRAAIPGVRLFMATLTSSLNSTNTAYGTSAVDAKRLAYNRFIETCGLFDGVIDFDAATYDAATGELQAAFQPNSSVGGPGDRLHPNRAGYLAMGWAIDPAAVAGDTTGATSAPVTGK